MITLGYIGPFESAPNPYKAPVKIYLLHALIVRRHNREVHREEGKPELLSVRIREKSFYGRDSTCSADRRADLL